MSPLCFPRFAVLDPEVTFSLPPRQVSNGVVDAFVHVLEQYLTYPAGGVLSDRLAEALLITLKEQGPLALRDPTNYDVRANLMWAASLALNGLIGQGVPQDWTTHHIGHELTALFGVDHARSLAVVLPAVLEAAASKKQKSYYSTGLACSESAARATPKPSIRTIAQTVASSSPSAFPPDSPPTASARTPSPKSSPKLKANRRLRMANDSISPRMPLERSSLSRSNQERARHSLFATMASYSSGVTSTTGRLASARHSDFSSLTRCTKPYTSRPRQRGLFPELGDDGLHRRAFGEPRASARLERRQIDGFVGGVRARRRSRA